MTLTRTATGILIEWPGGHSELPEDVVVMLLFNMEAKDAIRWLLDDGPPIRVGGLHLANGEAK